MGLRRRRRRCSGGGSFRCGCVSGSWVTGSSGRRGLSSDKVGCGCTTCVLPVIRHCGTLGHATPLLVFADAVAEISHCGP
jgi:hypothetical protein